MASAEREARKIGLGMLSTQMQRMEATVTGAPKGPPPISSTPEYFSVVAPTPEPRSRPRRPRQIAEEHPSHLASGPDLLWRPSDGNPLPSSTPRPERQALVRFFPSTNRGKPTSHQTLNNIASRRARDVANRAHYARAPARLAVRLSKEVLEMCREHAIDPRALMREGANPLAGQIPVMHGPYTPSWDYAIGAVEPGFDDPEAPSSARSAPASGRRAPQPPTGSKSARRPHAQQQKARNVAALDAEATAEVTQSVERELEEVRKRRQDQMRRRAAVALGEQRRHDKSVELEAQQEKWRDQRARAEMKKAQNAASAHKRHVGEADAAREQRRQEIEKEAEAEAAALAKRWTAAEAEEQARNRARLQAQRERAETEMEEHAVRVETNERRANMRAEAVAEYEQERIIAEEEANQRAVAFVEEKKQAAQTRVAGYEQQRKTNLEQRRTQIGRKEKAVQERYEQRLVHDILIEQQQRDRMMVPYRMHEKERQREAEAPREVRRLIQQREHRLKAQFQQDEEMIAENRHELGKQHAEWIADNREKRGEVVRRAEAAANERENRREQHAKQVAQFDAKVVKMRARRALRDAQLQLEREAFHAAQSTMMEAVYQSSIGAEVMTDGALEQVIAAPKKGKAGRRGD